MEESGRRSPPLRVLSAGAAQGLIEGLQREFLAAGFEVDAGFYPVGVVVERLRAGETCDAVVLTAARLEPLARSGEVRGDSIVLLGDVPTAVAVRSGQAAPEVSTAAALESALLAADAIYLPDIERSTAGAHCAAMLRTMGIRTTVTARIEQRPNGVAAMRALAQSRDANPIGCTQLTEIAISAGVALVGPLPEPFALVTAYCVAVAAHARAPELAGRFAALLAGEDSRELRRRCGFDA